MRILSVLSAAAAAVSLLVSCSEKNGPVDYAEGVRDLPDLSGKRVSVYSGSIQEFKVTELKPEAEISRFNSIAEMIAAVEKGHADYCIGDTICFIGAGMEERGLKHVFDTDRISGDVALAFRFDEAPLVAQFNEFLAEYKATGGFSEAFDRWTRGDVGSVEMPRIEMNPEGELLRVGLCNNFPFSFVKEDYYAGLEIELLERFAAHTGRRCEFQLIDLTGLIASLTTAKSDVICCSIFITEERQKVMLFSDPYYFCRSACFCRAEGSVAESKPFIRKMKESFYNNLILEDRWKIVLAGLWETLIISIFSILLGSIFGALLCWMALSKRKWLRGISNVYVEIIRGVPILVLLMIMFYVVFASGRVAARWVAVIAFAMNFGAYVSQMFQTGIKGVDKGQTEAGLAMGFSPLRTFFLFIVPQATKMIVPVFKGEAISLIKNTSVVGFIAIQDLTKASEIIRSRTFDAFFPLIVISIIYFVLAWLLGKGLDALSKKLA